MSEQKQRTTILCLAVFMTLLVTLMFLRSYLSAGDLNPPAAPAPTMHTLDDIFNNSSPLPKPDEVTIITKSRNSTTTNWETIHTVTSGKTFYLMGIQATISRAHYLSLDGGITVHFTFYASGAAAAVNQIAPPYPIASVAADTEIKVRAESTEPPDRITIWGYEKTNS